MSQLEVSFSRRAYPVLPLEPTSCLRSGTDNSFTIDHHPDPRLYFSSHTGTAPYTSIAILLLAKARSKEKITGRPATVGGIGMVAERYLLARSILEPGLPRDHANFLHDALSLLGEEGVRPKFRRGPRKFTLLIRSSTVQDSHRQHYESRQR